MNSPTNRLEPNRAAEVFADPVAYLAALGVVAELVAGAPLAEAA